MKACDLMTPSPCCCSPTDSLRDVAIMMRDNDCGAVPVVENGCIVGIVTDRDLTVRALAGGLGLDTKVSDVMTTDVFTCHFKDELETVEQIMADKQVRRVPVLDAYGCCAGMISQADLARAAQDREATEHEIAIVMERISAPSRLPLDGSVRGTAEYQI